MPWIEEHTNSNACQSDDDRYDRGQAPGSGGFGCNGAALSNGESFVSTHCNQNCGGIEPYCGSVYYFGGVNNLDCQGYE